MISIFKNTILNYIHILSSILTYCMMETIQCRLLHQITVPIVVTYSESVDLAGWPQKAGSALMGRLVFYAEAASPSAREQLRNSTFVTRSHINTFTIPASCFLTALASERLSLPQSFNEIKECMPKEKSMLMMKSHFSFTLLPCLMHLFLAGLLGFHAPLLKADTHMQRVDFFSFSVSLAFLSLLSLSLSLIPLFPLLLLFLSIS